MADFHIWNQIIFLTRMTRSRRVSLIFLCLSRYLPHSRNSRYDLSLLLNHYQNFFVYDCLIWNKTAHPALGMSRFILVISTNHPVTVIRYSIVFSNNSVLAACPEPVPVVRPDASAAAFSSSVLPLPEPGTFVTPGTGVGITIPYSA